MAKSRRSVIVLMFSSALASQVLLSGVSFVVALLLLRRSTDLQYGYFILVSGAIILAASLQGAFIGPAMVRRMTGLTPAQCGDLTGGLFREQRHVIGAVASLAVLGALALWTAHVLDGHTLPLVLAAIVATATALQREYFRMVLLAYRHAYEVLRGDLLYCVLLALGVLLATATPQPATAAVLALVLAAALSGLLLSWRLRRLEAWNTLGAPGILREIAPLASWSTAGAAIHWSFSQGYTYLVAALLDVRAVAAVAATRMLLMPVNLVTTGIGSLMLPLVARWLHDHGAPLVFRRLLWMALAMLGMAVCYFAALWILRDWIFAVILHKQFAQRDPLLMLWSASFAVMAVNQQLLWLPVVRERFRALTPLGAVSAALGLSCSALGMRYFGGAGAPLGILIGELASTVGLTLLCLREVAPELQDAPNTAAAAR